MMMPGIELEAIANAVGWLGLLVWVRQVVRHFFCLCPLFCIRVAAFWPLCSMHTYTYPVTQSVTGCCTWLLGALLLLWKAVNRRTCLWWRQQQQHEHASTTSYWLQRPLVARSWKYDTKDIPIDITLLHDREAAAPSLSHQSIACFHPWRSMSRDSRAGRDHRYKYYL